MNNDDGDVCTEAPITVKITTTTNIRINNSQKNNVMKTKYLNVYHRETTTPNYDEVERKNIKITLKIR